MSLPLVQLYSQKAQAVKEKWEKRGSQAAFWLRTNIFQA